MLKEEFLNQLNRYDALEKKYIEKHEKFHASFPTELSAVVFKYWPQLENKSSIAKNKVLALVKEYASDIWEVYGFASFSQFENEKVTYHPVRKPKTVEEAKKEMEIEIKAYPEDYHNEFCKGFWEDFFRRQHHEFFEEAIHNKMKKAFTDVYFDEVMSLEPDYLRYFNGSLFLLACRFVQDVYIIKRD